MREGDARVMREGDARNRPTSAVERGGAAARAWPARGRGRVALVPVAHSSQGLR